MEWVFISLAILVFLVISTYVWFVTITFGLLFRRPITKKQVYLKPFFGEGFNQHTEEIEKTQKLFADKKHIELKIVSKNVVLRGNLFENPKSDKVVIFVHGYYSTGMRDIGYLGDLYHDLKVNLLIIDQRATGNSEGMYSTLGAMERFDVREWIFHINNRYEGKKDIYLHGISMGAATSLLVTGLPNLPKTFKGVIADCGYSRTNGVLLYAGKRLVKIRPRVLIWGINLFARLFAGFNVNKVKVTKELKKNKTVPILFIHGTDDRFVPFNMSVKNYKAVTTPKKLVAFAGAAHCESYLKNKELYTAEVKEFLNVK